MRRIIHLSDLHFDHVDPALVAAFPQLIRDLNPHLLIISGDLTQRARTYQFREARAFLDQLPYRQLIVPGNHDIPLYNIWARIFTPYQNFQKYITPDLEPLFTDEEILVQGLNTICPYKIQAGKVKTKQKEKVLGIFKNSPPSLVKILVAHHPLNELSHLSPDILMTGHAHTSIIQTQTFQGFSFINLSCGTSTSTRQRGESNSFHFLQVESESKKIEIHAYYWDVKSSRFAIENKSNFRKGPEGWEVYKNLANILK